MNFAILCVLTLALVVSGIPFPEPGKPDGHSEQYETDHDLVTFAHRNETFSAKISFLEAHVGPESPLRVLLEMNEDKNGEILMPDGDYNHLKEAFEFINTGQLPPFDDPSPAYGKYLCEVKQQFDYLGIIATEWSEMVDLCQNSLAFHEKLETRLEKASQKIISALKSHVKLLLGSEWPSQSKYEIGVLPETVSEPCVKYNEESIYDVYFRWHDTVRIDNETILDDRSTLMDTVNEKLKQLQFVGIKYDYSMQPVKCKFRNSPEILKVPLFSVQRIRV